MQGTQSLVGLPALQPECLVECGTAKRHSLVIVSSRVDLYSRHEPRRSALALVALACRAGKGLCRRLIKESRRPRGRRGVRLQTRCGLAGRPAPLITGACCLSLLAVLHEAGLRIARELLV